VGAVLAGDADGGREVARDTVSTAGAPRTLTITPDKRVLAADGTSLSYVEATLTRAALPASIEVTYADGTGRGWTPAGAVGVCWATASNEATTITFDPVRAVAVRLTTTSPALGTAGGFLAIAELSAATG
jgi:hypothetical protein